MHESPDFSRRESQLVVEASASPHLVVEESASNFLKKSRREASASACRKIEILRQLPIAANSGFFQVPGAQFEAGSRSIEPSISPPSVTDAIDGSSCFTRTIYGFIHVGGMLTHWYVYIFILYQWRLWRPAATFR